MNTKFRSLEKKTSFTDSSSLLSTAMTDQCQMSISEKYIYVLTWQPWAQQLHNIMTALENFFELIDLGNENSWGLMVTISLEAS
jgi:hypothetical protein